MLQTCPQPVPSAIRPSRRLGAARLGLGQCLHPPNALQHHLNVKAAYQNRAHSFPQLGQGTHAARLTAAATSQQPAVTGTDTIESTTVFLRASDLPRSLLLDTLPEGKGQAVVVVGVLEGSDADKAGIVPGQKVLAISDPIRPDQLWPLGDRPSLKFIKDTISMMRNKDVGLQLSSQPQFTSQAATASDAESADEDSMTLVSEMRTSSNSSSGPAGTTLGDRLAQRYSEAQAVKQTKTDVQKRIEKRKEYMEQVSQRSDGSTFAWVGILFLGPAIVILGIAYATGYLDSMYINSLSAFR